MDSAEADKPLKELPFNNLFLNSGFVSGYNNWQFYLFTIAVTVLCYLLAPSITFIHLIIMAVKNGVDLETLRENQNILVDYKASGIDRNYILLAVFGIFAVTFVGFRLALRKFHHKMLTSVVTGYERFRRGRFWFALSLWSLLIFISAGVEYLLNPGNYTFSFDPGGFFISLVLILIFIPIQSTFEEVFFRGYLLQGLSQLTKNGTIPLLVTSLLFGLAHISNPEVDEYGWVVMLTYYVLFGLFLGCITLIDEGLELAIGIHMANNITSSVLVASDHSVIKPYALFEEKTTSVGGEILIWFVCAALAFFIFQKKYRWTNFKLIIK